MALGRIRSEWKQCPKIAGDYPKSGKYSPKAVNDCERGVSETYLYRGTDLNILAKPEKAKGPRQEEFFFFWELSPSFPLLFLFELEDWNRQIFSFLGRNAYEYSLRFFQEV
jgi:hypothetical protein